MEDNDVSPSHYLPGRGNILDFFARQYSSDQEQNETEKIPTQSSSKQNLRTNHHETKKTVEGDRRNEKRTASSKDRKQLLKKFQEEKFQTRKSASQVAARGLEPKTKAIQNITRRSASEQLRNSRRLSQPRSKEQPPSRRNRLPRSQSVPPPPSTRKRAQKQANAPLSNVTGKGTKHRNKLEGNRESMRRNSFANLPVGHNDDLIGKKSNAKEEYHGHSHQSSIGKDLPKSFSLINIPAGNDDPNGSPASSSLSSAELFSPRIRLDSTGSQNSRRDLSLLNASKAELASCYNDLLETEREKVELSRELENAERRLGDMNVAYKFQKLRAEEAENMIDILREKLEVLQLNFFDKNNMKDPSSKIAISSSDQNADSTRSEDQQQMNSGESSREGSQQERIENEGTTDAPFTSLQNGSSEAQGKKNNDMQLQKLLFCIEKLETSLITERQSKKEKELHILAQYNSQQVASKRVVALEDELNLTKTKLMKMEAEYKVFLDQNRALKEMIAEIEKDRNCQNKHVEQTIKFHEEKCAEFQRQIWRSDRLRISLHDEVLKLRGNIRVYTRVRPAAGVYETPFTFPLDDLGKQKIIECLSAQQDRGGLRAQRRRWRFAFDHVFQPIASQEEVYGEVSPLVQSAVDGYRVCVFAYGQTGSGKTYTMMGPEDTLTNEGEIDPQNGGIIFRAVQDIYERISELEAQGWTYSVSLQMIEVYNEQIWDLLPTREGQRENLSIRSTGNGTIEVVGLTSLEVADTPELLHHVTAALAGRASRETLANNFSSRSHCLFILNLKGNNLDGQSRNGVLNVVDLAGSERLSQIEDIHNADVVNETKAINKSLSALGNTIMCLARKEKHIPFRDTKITHLLQQSLGGDCKVLMFCNISPEAEHINESLCSLRFAKKVNECVVPEGNRKTKCQQCGF